MSLTLRQAIDRTLSRIALASGADVQVYAEEALKQIIQHKFDALFVDTWWPQFYVPGETYDLNGTTGEITGDISDKVKRYMDLRHVWYSTYANPLPRIHTRYNPAIVNKWSIGPSTDSTKVFKVFPSSLTGQVTISYRTKPDNFEEEEDVIDMDEHLIVLGSAYDYLNGLGINPGAEDKLLVMFNERLSQLRTEINSEEVSTDDYGMGAVNGWQDVGY